MGDPHSLGEALNVSVVAAVDVLNLLGEASSTVDNSLLSNGLSLVDVGAGESLTLNDTGVDGGLGVVETLVGPLGSVVCVVLSARHGVIALQLGDVATERAPGTLAQGKAGVTGVLVDDGVPDGVQVADATLGRKLLGVTTSVARWVIVVNFTGGVERLMNITNVVNHKSESEGSGILVVGEVVLDVVGVVVLGVTISQVGGKVSDSINDFVFFNDETEVTEGATLVEVWLIDEVPSALPRVALTLDVVGKGGAFDERIIAFIGGEAGVVLLKRLKFGLGGGKGVRSL